MRVVVIGGGITGLAAAYYLQKSGASVALVEKSPSLGGVIKTSVIQGCVIEHGPDSFLASKPWALDLVCELGLESELIGSNDAGRITYVLKQGRLVPLPEGLMMLAPTRLMPIATTPLLTWGAKVRMIAEYFRRRGRSETPDRSVEDFVLDHYGREALDYLAEPLLAGVYGGDPAALSVAAVLPRFAELEEKYGSLTRGALAERSRANDGGSVFRTLKGGLGCLVEALQPQEPLVRSAAGTIERRGEGLRVRVNAAWMECDAAVIACPAPQAAALVSGIDRELGDLLAAIPYNSAMTVALGYRRRDCPVSGFGFLVPKRERKSLLACTYVHNKFEHRAPDDVAILRCFLANQAETIPHLRGELDRILHIHAEALFMNAAIWPQSMAQYTLGHRDRVRRIDEIVARVPSLRLAGNAYHGIGIPDCIRSAKEAAESLISARLPAAPR